jgi:chorismate mutase
VVYFIGNNIDRNDSLDILREKLLENSRLLLSLFKERIDLGRSIGQVKRSMELDVRDRKQELQVLRKLDVHDSMEERFLNIIFELTIMSELSSEAADRDVPGKGARTLQEMLADLICLPGDRILTNEGIDLPFIQQAVSKGAHIVHEDCDTFDIRILISERSGNDSIQISNMCSNDTAIVPGRQDKPRVIKLEVSE